MAAAAAPEVAAAVVAVAAAAGLAGVDAARAPLVRHSAVGVPDVCEGGGGRQGGDGLAVSHASAATGPNQTHFNYLFKCFILLSRMVFFWHNKLTINNSDEPTVLYLPCISSEFRLIGIPIIRKYLCTVI